MKKIKSENWELRVSESVLFDENWDGPPMPGRVREIFVRLLNDGEHIGFFVLSGVDIVDSDNGCNWEQDTADFGCEDQTMLRELAEASGYDGNILDLSEQESRWGGPLPLGVALWVIASFKKGKDVHGNEWSSGVK